MRKFMRFKKLIATAIATSIIGGTLPVAGALYGGEPVIIDARSNFSEEFVNAKFVDIEDHDTFVYALTDDGELWAAGNVHKSLSSTPFYGFHKLMDGVQSFVDDGFLFVLKTDGSVWTNSNRVHAMGETSTSKMHKILDDAVDISPAGGVDRNGDVWIWGSELAYDCWPIDSDTIPAPYLESHDAGYRLAVPYKAFSDVKQFFRTENNTFIVDNDGVLYSCGSNLFGANANGKHDYSSTGTEFAKIMDNVKEVGHSGAYYAIQEDNTLWMWGQMGGHGRPLRVETTPVKIADDAKAATLVYGEPAYVTTDGKYHSPGTVNECSIFDMDDVAAIDEMLILKENGSLWAIKEPVSTGDKTQTGYYGINSLNYDKEWTDFDLVQLSGSDVTNPIVKDDEGSQGKNPETTQSVTVTASPISSKVLVNGVATTFDAYEINGNNYFKLRDVAHVLSGTEKQFEVTWDGAKSAINLISGQVYTDVGGEMTVGVAKQQTAKLSTDTVYLNDKEVKLTAYTINGNNYFKLRDLGDAFDFAVTWDSASQTIAIDASVGYTPE